MNEYRVARFLWPAVYKTDGACKIEIYLITSVQLKKQLIILITYLHALNRYVESDLSERLSFV